MLPLTQDFAERRGAPRRPVRVTVALQIEGRPLLTVRTVEVSASGVGLSCPINLPLGTRCQLSFLIPLAGRPIELRMQGATVMHSVLSQYDGGFRLGCQFVQLPSDIGQRLQAFARSAGL